VGGAEDLSPHVRVEEKRQLGGPVSDGAAQAARRLRLPGSEQCEPGDGVRNGKSVPQEQLLRRRVTQVARARDDTQRLSDARYERRTPERRAQRDLVDSGRECFDAILVAREGQREVPGQTGWIVERGATQLRLEPAVGDGGGLRGRIRRRRHD